MSSDGGAPRPQGEGGTTPPLQPRRGLLFVVSAPSGAGKTTLVERLVERVPRLQMSHSYTSRAARPGERDGLDYHFVSREAFEARVSDNEFLEWADVFGNLYGTAAPDTERVLAAGDDIVLVIDVQGAAQVRRRGLALISAFILPPDFATLERRLRGRSKDDEAAIRRRLQTAREEVLHFREYDYVVVNDDLERAVTHLEGMVYAERSRRAHMVDIAERIVATFET